VIVEEIAHGRHDCRPPACWSESKQQALALPDRTNSGSRIPIRMPEVFIARATGSRRPAEPDRLLRPRPSSPPGRHLARRPDERYRNRTLGTHDHDTEYTRSLMELRGRLRAFIAKRVRRCSGGICSKRSFQDP
jgi:hypothetical protein